MIRSKHQIGYALLLAMLLACEAFAAEVDEAAIREVQSRQAAAWNAHDALAYANLFTDDGDVVTPVPPREGIQIQVLRKTGGQWLIDELSEHEQRSRKSRSRRGRRPRLSEGHADFLMSALVAIFTTAATVARSTVSSTTSFAFAMISLTSVADGSSITAQPVLNARLARTRSARSLVSSSRCLHRCRCLRVGDTQYSQARRAAALEDRTHGAIRLGTRPNRLRYSARTHP